MEVDLPGDEHRRRPPRSEHESGPPEVNMGVDPLQVNMEVDSPPPEVNIEVDPHPQKWMQKRWWKRTSEEVIWASGQHALEKRLPCLNMLLVYSYRLQTAKLKLGNLKYVCFYNSIQIFLKLSTLNPYGV